MVRVNNQYLNLFPGTEIFIEKRAKLFQELDGTFGDFSYSFEFPRTSYNVQALGFPLADVSGKTINIPCDIVGKDGIPIYTGTLSIEKINRRAITASFFSGNYNWLSLLTGDLSDLDFSEYDTDQDYLSILAAWSNTSGMTFPFIDNGALVTRSYKDMFLEDFAGALYVKSIFKKIFYSEGIKFQGELINDWVFDRLIVTRNSKNKEQINSRSSYANKTSTQTYSTTTTAKVTFTDDSTDPFFDGSLGNYSTANSRYTADVDMRVKVEANLIMTRTGVALASFYIYKNGAQFEVIHPNGSKTISLTTGDYIELYLDFTVPVAGDIVIELDSTFKITPTYIYKAFGNAVVPKWTKQQFVNNILNLFNVISDYDPISKTVTFNLFEKLKTQTAIDISEYIDPSTIELDFKEILQNYGRSNYLSYQASEDEDLKIYNIAEFIKYGSGSIDIANVYLQASAQIISSDFKAPISYKNPAFDASLERTNFVGLEEGDDANITTVADDGAGVARFNIDADEFVVGDLVRVTESSNEMYLGDWRVSEQGAGYVKLKGVEFDTTATGVIKKLEFTFNTNDDTYIFINMPAYNVSNYSSIVNFFVETNSNTSPAYAYFNLLDMGKTANDVLKQGLSFGEVNDPLFYQRTLKQTYWRSVENILNDPVKLKAYFYFPDSVFRSLGPLQPVYLKTNETVNLYYIERIAGYISSNKPCEVELIKL